MAETETPKAAAPAGKSGKGKKEKKPKKEKKVKAPKPEKEKKPKAPKPKKEKKTKAPKPKKEKKAKKGKSSGGGDEEGKGKGGLFANKKLLILLIGIVVLMGVAAFLVLKVFKLFPSQPEGPELTESSDFVEPDGETEQETPDETGEDGETESPEQTEDSPEQEQKYPTEIHTQITNAQVMEFVQALSPSLLGLEGEDMSGYEMFASDNVSIIDGMYCTQVRVYSKNPSAGTNDIEGIYFVSRGSQRHLYRYDEFTETVTEIPMR